MANSLTPVILGIAGAILSLVFSYVPAVKVWWDKQNNNGLLMVLFVALVSAAYFGLSCTPLGVQLGIQVSCTQVDALNVFWGFMGCLVGNQLMYQANGVAPVKAV